MEMNGIDYTGDPRAVLIHKGGGNPYHDPKNGQFTSKSFGIGKYQNPDGSLTAEGHRRLALELKRNLKKKKDDQVKPKEGMTVREILTDPNKWWEDDLNNYASGLSAGKDFANTAYQFLEKSEKKKPFTRKKKLRLDNMTNEELNQQINRYLLEQKYLDIFDPKQPPEVSKGKKFLMNTLEYGGGILAMGVSAVTIAKAINSMKK